MKTYNNRPPNNLRYLVILLSCLHYLPLFATAKRSLKRTHSNQLVHQRPLTMTAPFYSIGMLVIRGKEINNEDFHSSRQIYC